MFLGLAGNVSNLPLFFGVDFIFGSIATLIAIAVFGRTWGTILTIPAAIYTIVLWNHPYAAIVLILEALYVGTFLPRLRSNLALASATYWIALGMPQVWAYYRFPLGMDDSGAWLAALKQGTNGIFNAMIASLIITYTPLSRWMGGKNRPRLTVFQTIFNIFVAAALIPALILMVQDSRGVVNQLERDTKARLETISTGITLSVERWRAQHIAALNLVAKIAQDAGMDDPSRLQPFTEEVRSSFPDLHGTFITDEEGRTVAFDPLQNTRGESTLGIDFSDRAYFQELKNNPSGSHVSSVFMARGGVFEPVFNVSSPIVINGEFKGIASASVNLHHLAEIMRSVGEQTGYSATLIDDQGHVIVSNSPKFPSLMTYVVPSDGAREPMANGYFHHWPKSRDIAPMSQWKDSSIGREVSIPGPGQWRLVVEIPLGPQQTILYSRYIQQLTRLLALVIAILLGSVWVASRISRPMAQLSDETTNLPERLAADESIQWPSTRLWEIKVLVENFRTMIEALKKRFHDLESSTQKLDEANLTLKTQVDERDRVAEELKEQTRIVELVSQVGLSLQGDLELETIIQTATDAATELTNANFGAFLYKARTDEGENYTLYTLSGTSQEAFAALPVPRKAELFKPTFEDTEVVRLDDVTQSPLFTQPDAGAGGSVEPVLPLKSYLAVPVVSRSKEILGGLFFGHKESAVFTPSAERLVVGIAAQTAAAIDNARLYEAQRASENKARELAQTQSFLAEAGKLLGSTLEVDTILMNLSQLVVPSFADWCVIDLLDGRRNLVPFSLVHVNPQMQKQAEDFEARSKGPRSLSDQTLSARVIESGEPEVISSDALAALANRNPAPDYADLLRALGARTAICVPLKARERVFGALTLVSAKADARLRDTILRVADELARRASVAIDHARLYSESQAVNHIKDEFLATLSHELRTPLTAILGHSELLKMAETSLDPDSRESVEAIHRNAKAQLQIIGDLLDASAIITGKLSFTPVIMDPTDVVKNAVESIRFAAESKGVHLTLEFDRDSRGQIRYCEILGDPTRLQQVVWNLLSNAVKFTDKDGTVQVRTQVTDSQYRIEVRDTGHGIEPDFLPYVFDRFRQEDSSITRRFGGLGLGLSIVRQLVEAHGGTIRVESEGKGRGATFSVYLPTLKPEFGDNA